MRRQKRTRKAWGLLLSAAMLVTGLADGAAAPPASAEASAAGYGISNPTTDSDGITTWDCVYFGNYWQNDTNGDGTADTDDEKEPIKWRVLSVDGDDAFLLADQNLDAKPYNETDTDVTWETCTMRSWLNGYGAESNVDEKDYSTDNFMDMAFSGGEKEAIRETSVINDGNSEYGTEGGSDTQDKVYLLSIAEAGNAAYGFQAMSSEGNKTREAKNTEYATAQGVDTESNSNIYIYAGNGWWWLRSPGYTSNYASYVSNDGYGFYNGNIVDNIYHAARPALHLNLSSNLWRSAGKVTSAGESTGEETATPPTPENPAGSEEPSGSGNPPVPSSSAGSPSQTTVSSPTGSPSQSMVPSPTGSPSQTAAPQTTQPAPSPDLGTVPSVPKVKGLAAKPGRKKLTVTWKKVSGADGYQIQVGIAKSFAGAAKKTVSSSGKTTYAAGRLKAKKKYYIRVRAYKTYTDASGRKKKAYGKWKTITKKTK